MNSIAQFMDYDSSFPNNNNNSLYKAIIMSSQDTLSSSLLFSKFNLILNLTAHFREILLLGLTKSSPTSPRWKKRGSRGSKCSLSLPWRTSSSGDHSSLSHFSTGAGSGNKLRSQCPMRSASNINIQVAIEISSIIYGPNSAGREKSA